MTVLIDLATAEGEKKGGEGGRAKRGGGTWFYIH